MTYRVLSLFAGIGGFDLGLERTGGFKTVAFCEIAPKCRHLLNHHWPEVPTYDDVRTLTADRLRADGIAVDAICGGFPCQDISLAGKGAGLAGERSGLWREYARLIRELRPRFVLVENVAALLGRGLGDVLGDLASLGYDAVWDRIRAFDVGAPHLRARLWIVAYARGEQHEGFGHAVRRALAEGLLEAYLANTDSRGRPAGHSAAKALGSRRTAAASRGHVADASGPRQSYDQGSGAAEGLERDGAADGDRWPSRGGYDWSAEPDVGRVAHGVPAELDGVHGSLATKEHDQEGGPEGDRRSGRVPSVRGDGSAGATPSRLQSSEPNRGLVPVLPREGRSAGRNAEGQGNKELHDLRDGVRADAQQEAHDLQPCMSSGSRPPQCREALGWAQEPDVPRVAHSVPERVARLHGLGNAVVPEIPYRLGRAILAAEAERLAA